MGDEEETTKTNTQESKPPVTSKEQEDNENKSPEQELKKQPLREELVNTAVHFLQNPKVQSSSLVQKRAFLLRKGLTSEEVDLAIERSGQLKPYRNNNPSVSHQSKPLPLPPVLIPNQAPQNVPPPLLQTVWTKVYNLMSFAVTLGGVYYGAIIIYKRYIEPRLATSKANILDVSVENQLLEINESVVQLQHCLQEVQATLKKQQETLNELACPDFKNKDLLNRGGAYGTETALAELKAEVATIKSLLLSRRQFPTTPLSNPSIPSWQLVNGDSTEESLSEKLNGVGDDSEDQVNLKEHNQEATEAQDTNQSITES